MYELSCYNEKCYFQQNSVKFNASESSCWYLNALNGLKDLFNDEEFISVPKVIDSVIAIRRVAK